jgi:nucleotide-binding universal stress UspA family protein
VQSRGAASAIPWRGKCDPGKESPPGTVHSSAVPSAAPLNAEPASQLPAKRILVVFERGRAGVAAVELARELAARSDASVTAVSIAPQAGTLRGCIPSAQPYNDAVLDDVAKELKQAEELLWPLGSRGECRLLVEGVDPALDEFVVAQHFDLVLLPARRRPLRSTKHPAAAALRRLGAEVRVVAGSPRPDA